MWGGVEAAGEGTAPGTREHRAHHQSVWPGTWVSVAEPSWSWRRSQALRTETCRPVPHRSQARSREALWESDIKLPFLGAFRGPSAWL